MEITARRLDSALAGTTIDSARAPGINALKTFDPPLDALAGAELEAVRRRGKLLLLDVKAPAHGPLTLLTHLMSAGRFQLADKRASMRDRTARVLLRFPTPDQPDRELRLREFGTRQAAWVKLLTPEALDAEPSLHDPRPRGLAGPARRRAARAALLTPAAALAAARPAGDRRHRPHLGRRDPPRSRKLSPFKRGDDLSEAEAATLRAAIVSELQRVLDVYEERVGAAAAREVPQADAGPRAPGRALPALRDRPRGGVLRGLRHDLLPVLPDGGPHPQGPPALAPAEVTTKETDDRARHQGPGLHPARPGRQRRHALRPRRAHRRPVLLPQGRTPPGCTDAGVRHARPRRRLRGRRRDGARRLARLRSATSSASTTSSR